MIFSSRKNGDNDFTEVVATTLKDLGYLNDRIMSVFEKIQNPNLVIASKCINSMRNEIQNATVNSGPNQTLRG